MGYRFFIFKPKLGSLALFILLPLKRNFMQNEQLILKLNNKLPHVRMRALKKLAKAEKTDESLKPLTENASVCSNLKTFYSGCPYAPALAIYNAYKKGVKILGITDNSSFAAYNELRKCAEILGFLYFIGAEADCKARVKNDNVTVKLCAYAVPHGNVNDFDEDIEKLRKLKMKYFENLCEKINLRLKEYKINLSVSDVTCYLCRKKGSVSVETVYNALAKKIQEKFSNGKALIDFLTVNLKIKLSELETKELSDFSSTFYIYDFAQILYNNLKIKAEEELTDAKYFADLCRKYNSVSALVYEKNTDAEIAEQIIDMKGINALAINISEFTEDEIEKIYDRFTERGTFVIGRYVVDNPRKKFKESIENNVIRGKLLESSAALVGSEIASSISNFDGMFTDETVKKFPELSERIRLYSRIGLKGQKI